jgi:hypothetical protein
MNRFHKSRFSIGRLSKLRQPFLRYAYWCVANGVLKFAAKAKTAKAGGH